MIDIAATIETLTPDELMKVDQLARITDFIWTPTFGKFVSLKHSVIGLFTGNQAMKTSSVAYQYVLRMLGWHPTPIKNHLYFECENEDCPRAYVIESSPFARPRDKRPEDNICRRCGSKLRIRPRVSHTYRFCAATLPSDKPGKDIVAIAETRNTIYPEFRKWLPPFMVKRDITHRNPAMVLHDFNRGRTFGDLVYTNAEIVVEFFGYHQDVQDAAGVQRCSIWCDEEPPKALFDELMPRLMMDRGDFILSLTPANHISWTFDTIYERAAMIIRSSTICDYMKKKYPQRNFEEIEKTDSKVKHIAIVLAATDDNPTMPKDQIEEKYLTADDPDTAETRRYGIFTQTLGNIFKKFDYNVHVINAGEYFPDGMYHTSEWRYGRAIDYHQRTPWAIIWAALSPENEMFVWQEWNPNPEKNTTESICEVVAQQSGSRTYTVDLIDRLAAQNQVNTNTTVIEDMNRIFRRLQGEGIGNGGRWRDWETRNTIGRNRVMERLNNGLTVGRPFNNRTVDKNGNKVYLPTLWIFNNCMKTAQSLKNWSWDEYRDPTMRITKEKKEVPKQKFSHFCTAIEAMLKDNQWRPIVKQKNYAPPPVGRFQGGRHAVV